MLSSQTSDVAATARAFATYSLVPYLGILFCPGAVLVGLFGVVKSYRKTKDGSRTICYLSALFGLVIFGLQLLLWWMLYKVPIWAKGL
jgi:hypothetical protein